MIRDTLRDESGRRLRDETVAEIVRRVVAVASPERVILFGSAARGDMGPHSDIDLLEREVADARLETLRIRSALADLPSPFDIVVMSVQRFEETRDVIGHRLAGGAVRQARV